MVNSSIKIQTKCGMVAKRTCALCGQRNAGTAVTCDSCGELLQPAGPPLRKAGGDLNAVLVDDNPLAASFEDPPHDQSAGVPLPDFGLQKLGAFLRGDSLLATSQRAFDADYGSTSGTDAATMVNPQQSRRTSTRERMLLLLLLPPPVLQVTQPFWDMTYWPQEDRGSWIGDPFEYPPLRTLYALSMGLPMLVTTVVCFRTLCSVTHPIPSVELVTGVTYKTTQGHLSRLIAECGSVPQSEVSRLRSTRRLLAAASVFAAGMWLLGWIVWLPSADMRNRMLFCALVPFIPLWLFLVSAWIFTLRVATRITSVAMFLRAKQTGTLATTVQRPRKGYTIFGSMRFPVSQEARQLREALAASGLMMHIVETQAGQDITDEVFEWIEYADTFLVFGTRNYGEDTGNPASSCAESKYAQNQKKRIILIRMIPWEEEFDHLQARVLFGQNKLTLEWQVGTPMPPFLCQQIIDAVNVGGSEQLDETNDTGRRLSDTGLISGNLLDDKQWRAKVEAPALRLAHTTLPTLSEGWGWSVGWVCFFCQLGALGNHVFYMHDHVYEAMYTELREGQFNNATDVMAWFMIMIAIPLIWTLYCLMTVGEITDACQRLESSINTYCVRDLRMYRLVRPLSTALRSQNRGQGLGFTIFGQVFTTEWFCAAIAIFSFAGYTALMAMVGGDEQSLGMVGKQQACPDGWTFADEKCLQIFGSPKTKDHLELRWQEAELACQSMGVGTHLASLTSQAQQTAASQLATMWADDDVWIGLNSMDASTFVWTDEEALSFEHWSESQIPDQSRGLEVVMRKYEHWKWARIYRHDARHAYICAKEPLSSQMASGGYMLGCAGGHWVLGSPFKRILGLRSQTIVDGIYDKKTYDMIAPTKITINATLNPSIPTPAKCAALVRRDYPNASAAVYSNIFGDDECTAAFESRGVIYDPDVQTCVFE